MRDFTNNRGPQPKIRRFFISIGVALFLVFLCVSSVKAAWGMYGKFTESSAANDAAQQNLLALQQQKATIQAEVNQLSTTEGQEEQMRESYGVAEPGEGEIQIIRTATTTPPPKPPEPNVVVRVLRALFAW